MKPEERIATDSRTNLLRAEPINNLIAYGYVAFPNKTQENLAYDIQKAFDSKNKTLLNEIFTKIKDLPNEAEE